MKDTTLYLPTLVSEKPKAIGDYFCLKDRVACGMLYYANQYFSDAWGNDIHPSHWLKTVSASSYLLSLLEEVLPSEEEIEQIAIKPDYSPEEYFAFKDGIEALRDRLLSHLTSK